MISHSGERAARGHRKEGQVHDTAGNLRMRGVRLRTQEHQNIESALQGEDVFENLNLSTRWFTYSFTVLLGPTTQAGRDQIQAQTGEKAAHR